MRCHWTHAHGPHQWTPLVQDPDSDRVLHIFTEPAAQLECPGLRCRCTMLSPQTHIEPAEWEQAADCPVHPL